VRESRVDDLKKLLELTPEDSEIHYMLGTEYMNQGEFLQAIHHFQAYLSREKGDVGACYGQLAAAYRGMGDVKAAEAAYRQGIQSALLHHHKDLARELTEGLRQLREEAR
jgi:Flp pilus assembly protein TadD